MQQETATIARLETAPPDLDLSKFDWMPDWTGQTVVVVASGPSAKGVELVEGAGLAKFITINDSWKLAPWADVLYACDYAWWLKARGKPDWPNLRVSQDRIACEMFPEIKRIYVHRKAEHMVFGQLGQISWGGNSGFQAVNLAAIWGAKKILLVGYDMCLTNGVHWHKPHGPGLSNPRELTIERWRQRLDKAAADLERHGVRVINCSMTSALKNYEKMPFEKALVA